MGNYKIFFFFFVLAIFLFSPKNVFALEQDLVISEIMYDYPNVDTGHEWVEFYNSGESAITIIGGSTDDAWRFYDGSNHLLSNTAVQGSMTIDPGEFIVIAQDTATFLTDNPSFSGNLIQSSGMSLNNTSAKIGLRIGSSGTVWSAVTYQNSWGGNGDGVTLARVSFAVDPNDSANWQAGSIGGTPGSQNIFPTPTPSPTPTEEPEEAPEPTSTPEPTNTPTPSPTPTKKPTPTLIPTPTGEILGEEESATNAFYPLATEEAESTSQSGSSFKTRWLPKIFLGVGFLLLFGAAFWVWYTKLRWPEQESS